ncbi:MAG: hypothetical protein V1858_04830 [Candidatus Gottesmanbacteria bacterium]
MTVERICRQDGKDVIFIDKDIFGEEETVVPCTHGLETEKDNGLGQASGLQGSVEALKK